MATTTLVEVPGATRALYDRVNRELGIGPGRLPEGLVAHYATVNDDGITIFDVWTSREAFEHYAAKAAPVIARVAGAQAASEPKLGELVNALHAARATV